MGDIDGNYRTRAVSRRKFLAYVGAFAAAAAAGQLIGGGSSLKRISAAETFEHKLYLTGVALAGDLTNTFFLDPEHSVGKAGCPLPHQGSRLCHGCVACHSHAENKLFASIAAAESGRAHLGCKCLIRSEQVTQQDFDALFGAAVERVSFDRRRDTLFS